MISSLKEIISLNGNFKNAINLYLNLNKQDKIESYIPTLSSTSILKKYLGYVLENKNQSTMLLGPYGKGKSHLLLILLAILSLEDKELKGSLIKKISEVDPEAGKLARQIDNENRKYLPIIISYSQDDINQTFMVALNDALKKANALNLMPDSFFDSAIETIKRWKKEFPDTYESFGELLSKNNSSIKNIESALKAYNTDALNLFKKVYPSLTAGSEFNPLVGGDVLVMYKSVADKLKDEYGYSGIYIVFDEFSKYIESQSKSSVGNKMKVLQDICELASESKDPQIFMTFVTHKAIKEYGNYLPDAVINAFTGIEGRIDEEIQFTTSSKNNYELIKNAISCREDLLKEVPNYDRFFGNEAIDDFYKLSAFKTAFNRDDFETIVVKGCYPMSPVSAYSLLSVSEKVAQNERTLFTFISKDEKYSLARYVAEHNGGDSRKWRVAPDLIFDYFKSIFKKDVNNEFVHNEWLNADYAIGKTDDEDEIKILKTLAIINIINRPEEISATEENLLFVSDVINLEAVSNLVEKKLIYKSGATNCYKFKTRAGIELKKEIQNRRALKSDSVNVASVLQSVSDIQYVLPRKYNHDYSMTRYFKFEYMETEDFLNLKNLNSLVNVEGCLDGKVIALVDSKNIKEIKDKLNDSKVDNLVVVCPKKAFVLSKQAKDYEIIVDIANDDSFIKDNEVLVNEINIMREDLEQELTDYIDSAYKTEENFDVLYIYNDRVEKCSSYSKAVDKVVDSIYSKTVKINNEMINKQYITTAPIKKARRIIVDNLLKKLSDSDFLVGTSPECTIYRAVVVNSGLDKEEKPDNILELLNELKSFFEKCIESKRCFKEFTNIYYAKPYGMRAGVLPIILAYVISNMNEDVIVYKGKQEVDLDEEVLINLCEYPDEFSFFISKEDAKKEKYLKELVETFDPDCFASLSGTRISNVVTCMQRWYRSLPLASKNIKSVSEYIKDETTVSILPKYKNIMQKVDVNSYELLFVTLPDICGSSGDYENTVKKLREIKSLLNGYYEWLLDNTVNCTISLFDPKAKDSLNNTIKSWYNKQSDIAKNGLNNTRVTGFMNYIESINTFDDRAIVQKLVKIVSEIYIDAWNDDSLESYLEELKSIKADVEAIKETKATDGKCELLFTDSQGIIQKKYYERASEETGSILRNIIDDTLEDFSDISVNDKVAILMEAIEKVLKKED